MCFQAQVPPTRQSCVCRMPSLLSLSRNVDPAPPPWQASCMVTMPLGHCPAPPTAPPNTCPAHPTFLHPSMVSHSPSWSHQGGAMPAGAYGLHGPPEWCTRESLPGSLLSVRAYRRVFPAACCLSGHTGESSRQPAVCQGIQESLPGSLLSVGGTRGRVCPAACCLGHARARVCPAACCLSGGTRGRESARQPAVSQGARAGESLPGSLLSLRGHARARVCPAACCLSGGTRGRESARQPAVSQGARAGESLPGSLLSLRARAGESARQPALSQGTRGRVCPAACCLSGQLCLYCPLFNLRDSVRLCLARPRQGDSLSLGAFIPRLGPALAQPSTGPGASTAGWGLQPVCCRSSD
ncbi:uncharacterized protein LOC127046516 isoform X2 [Gopherus flavomarginatus]|uniref:uncharacterized protein LOC127046516 isoform X2 n=1 Tax=Gopherus flavomarginatus TaxID=286002 RepID=UPI0021CC1219|nr:uncharacterized protein LOC127046516 isoform X2 [Gopherus flavomarginatus]